MEHRLVLWFDTKEEKERFHDWYIDGGGDGLSPFNIKNWDKNFIYLKAPESACKKCKCWHSDYNHNSTRPKECDNCGTKLCKLKK